MIGDTRMDRVHSLIANRGSLVHAEEATHAVRCGRWQETSYETRSQQNPEGVLVIRVPEPEMIGGHSHLEMLHEANIKSVQREPSQTEKGATKCASPGEITSTIQLIIPGSADDRPR